MLEFSLRDLQRFVKRCKRKRKCGCWNWTGYRDKKGYGQFSFKGKIWWSHRWSFAAFKKSIEDGMTIHHTCFNTSCVNPAHLTELPIEENSRIRKCKRNTGYVPLHRDKWRKMSKTERKELMRGCPI